LSLSSSVSPQARSANDLNQVVYSHDVVQQVVNQLNLHQLQSTQQLRLWVNQQPYFVQITPYQNHNQLNWLIVTTVPEADFIGEINLNLWRTVLLCGLTLLGATATGILTAYWITKPIQRLSRASQALAAGDWQQALKEDSRISEFSALAKSFNRTAEQLQTSFDQIKVALLESESKFAKVFRNCPDPIAITSVGDGGQYLEVNDSFLTFSEYSREELLGRTSADLGLSLYPQQERELVQQLITYRRVKSFEFHYRTKSGKLGTTLLSIELIELDGQLRALTVAKDITERKQSEQALRDSEARFHKVAAAAPGEIYILVQHLDGSYEFEYMSQGCQEIQELSPEEIMANPQLSFEQVHPNDRTMMYATAARSAETLEPFTQEWRIIPPSGTVKWVQLSSRPERRDNGDIVWYGVLQDITQRKQAEAALRESEARFQEIAHTVNQCFFIRSAVTQEYLYVSPAYEKIWGRSCASLYQEPQSWFESVHPEDRELVQAALQQQQQGQNVKGEYRIIHPDGSERWVLAETTLIRDATGQPLHLVGLAKDVTDRKQAELELQHQQALRETIFNESTDAIFLVDPDTLLITDCNRQAMELFEVDHKADLIGIEGRTLQRRPFTETEMDEIALAMQQKGFWSLELEYITRKGNLFWGNLAAKPVQIGDQSINLVRVTDITARKQAEATMKRQLTAIEAAIEGIAILEQGTYSYLNQAHLELFGYHQPHDLLGKSWRILYSAQEIQRFEQEILPSLIQHRSWQGEVTALRQDGSTFAEGLSLTLTENDTLICVCRDVSDRHRLDRIKDEFISIVSHELRTPLTAIRGSLGILETGVLDDEPETAKRMLQVALKNSDRLVKLVNDILDLERLESGTVQLELEPCDVAELLEQAMESVQTIAAQAGITIHLSPLSTQVWAAPAAIVQTLTNLLSNAIKFSAAGSTVWVKAIVVANELVPNTNTDSNETNNLASATDPIVLFSIQDQGRGIPAEKLENIFGRFQQVDVSDSRQKGGTGLGLAICRSIIQQHGGKIWAESTLEVGSTFYFTLPMISNELP
jgi:PAS domain S-box-containing protein